MEDFYKPVELFSVELGRGLANDKEFMDNFFEEIEWRREDHFKTYGVVVPKIKTYVNTDLPDREYRICISGIAVDEFLLKKNSLLAILTGEETKQIDGLKTKEPTFHADALWISSTKQNEAEQAEYSIVLPHTILATHLFELIKQNQSLVITTKYVNNLLEDCKKENEYLINEYKEKFGLNNLSTLKQILQNLSKEKLNIRDIERILEIMCDSQKDLLKPDIPKLTEEVRLAIAPQTILSLCDEKKKIKVINFYINNTDIYNLPRAFLEKVKSILLESIKETNIIISPDSNRRDIQILVSKVIGFKNFKIFSLSEFTEAREINPNLVIKTVSKIEDPNPEIIDMNKSIDDSTFQKDKVIEQIKGSDVIITNENENIAVGLRYDKEKEEPKFLFANNNLDEIKKISSEYELVFTNACAPDLAKDLFDEYQKDQKSIPESSYKSISKIYANLHKKGLWHAS